MAATEGDGYKIVHGEELERTGGWRLVRRTLEIDSFGVNLVDIPPGESIPEHDELERDQEELFVALGGLPVIVIDGEEHPFPSGSFARVDQACRRTLRNDGPVDATVLIVSAPSTSGYDPMEWA
ncbi:MAG: cupin domain-containing protein [Solirubrobacteraceae bacterium]